MNATIHHPTGRRRGAWLAGVALVLAGLLAACAPATERAAKKDNGYTPEAGAYEIWAVDQGTNIIYIYDERHRLVDRVELAEHGVQTAHMISFSQDREYAVIASTASGNVTVIRADDREVVEVIDTGPRTHMASFTLDDRAIVVDVIGSPDHYRDGRIVEIEADLNNETFRTGRTLTLAEDPLIRDHSGRFEDTGPICHEYGPNGTHAFITLGPGLANGGLVVLNTDTWRLDAAFGPAELPVNCGTVPNADRSQMVLTAGSDEVGHFYVLDTQSFEVVHDADTRGIDAHGVWLTPDGGEFWMVNRVSDDGIVVDAETYEVLDYFDEVGGTPDIMAISPGGQYVYTSLRGPNPKSAAHVAYGETPGFSVLSTADASLVDVVLPDGDNPDSDFHGIAVRALQ